MRAEGELGGAGGSLRLCVAEGNVPCTCAVLVAGNFAPRSGTPEEEIARALREAGTPFVVLVNGGTDGEELCAQLREKLGAPACAADCLSENEDYGELFSCLLLAFPARRIDFDLPAWMCALPEDSACVSSVLGALREAAPSVRSVHNRSRICRWAYHRRYSDRNFRSRGFDRSSIRAVKSRYNCS